MRWEQAFRQLKKADQALAEAFDAFYHQLDSDAQSRVQVCVKSYPFTARILDTGTPYWPGPAKVDDDYIVAKGVPFAVILSKSCEIFEYTIPLLPKSPRPTALLSKGDCIGLFELFDNADASAHGGKPDWNISAGSVNIRNLVNFNIAGTINKLKKLFGNFDADRFRKCPTLSEKATYIPQIEAELSDWKVDLLYFNRAWFQYLFEHEESATRMGAAASRLKNALYGAGWRSVSRIRAANTSFMRFFSPGLRTNADMHLVESSHDFTAMVADAVYSRMPVFVLDRDGDDVAPIEALCQTLLAPFMDDPIAIKPAYLDPNNSYNVGYLPLDYVSAYIVSRTGVRFGLSNQSTRHRIVSMVEKIRNASDLVLDEQVDLPILARLDEMLDHISFRVPSTGSASNGNARTNTEFRLSLNTSHTRTRSIEQMDLATEDFFQPYLKELENQRCEFFRTSARIQAYRPGR